MECGISSELLMVPLEDLWPSLLVRAQPRTQCFVIVPPGCHIILQPP